MEIEVNVPEVHGVDEGVGPVGGPQALVVGELGHVPHELEHDLGQLDGVALRAVAATRGAAEAAGAVGDVRLVVDAVEVLAVPAAVESVSMFSILSPHPPLVEEELGFD